MTQNQSDEKKFVMKIKICFKSFDSLLLVTSDHLPIIAEVCIKVQEEKNQKQLKKVHEELYAQQKWIECLVGQELNEDRRCQ